MEIMLMLFAGAMLFQIARSLRTLRREEDRPAMPFLGCSSLWSERGRVVEVWGILFIPLHVNTYSHSTMLLD